MATTRIMPLHVGKGRTESRAISDIIDYVANPQKTDNGRLIAGFACDSRTVDAEFLLAKRQYISHAVGVLKNGGFLTVDDDGFLHLTVIGREIAEKIYERHLFFMEQFIAAGVDQETAEQDACRIEHAISDTSFRKLKEKVQGTD